MSPRILWVVPKWPLPAQDGARVATRALISEAAKYATIDLLSLVPPSAGIDELQAKRELGVSEIFTVRREAQPFGMKKWAFRLKNALFHPGTPLTAAPFATSKVLAGVASALSGRSWDFTVIDGLHGAVALGLGQKDPDPRFGKLIYRAHNVEAELWAQAALLAPSWGERILLSHQHRKFRRLETQLGRSCSFIFPVSEDDARAFRSQLHLNPAHQGTSPVIETIPIGQDFSQTREKSPAKEAASGDEMRLLFIGTLDWLPNRQGLEWFLSEVWPEASRIRAGLKLEVIGQGGQGRRGYPSARVTFHGRVKNLTLHYPRCSLSIVPIFLGGGTRVKALEAACFGLPCLSTALGVQGLGLEPGKSYFRAETREDWIQALLEIDPSQCSVVGQRARSQLMAQFDRETVGKRFWNQISSLSNS